MHLAQKLAQTVGVATCDLQAVMLLWVLSKLAVLSVSLFCRDFDDSVAESRRRQNTTQERKKT